MKIEYYDKEIAPLAWLADITKGIAKITCGNHVEKQDDFFVAGAWNGAYSNANFCSAEWFCGTGGCYATRR